MIKIEVTCTNEECEAKLEAEVRMDSPPVAGKLSGPWEDCYPPEPAEFSLVEDIVCHKCGEKMDERDFFDLYDEEVQEGFNLR
jgi:hypothetical protein